MNSRPGLTTNGGRWADAQTALRDLGTVIEDLDQAGADALAAVTESIKGLTARAARRRHERQQASGARAPQSEGERRWRSGGVTSPS